MLEAFKPFYVVKFFTTWMVVLALAGEWTSQWVSLPFLAFITLTLGLYFSYVNPGKFVFYWGEERLEYRGLEKLFFVDLFFHMYLFFWVWSHYEITGWWDGRLWAAILLLVLYRCLVSMEDVYGVAEKEVAAVFAGAVLAYGALVHIIKVRSS